MLFRSKKTSQAGSTGAAAAVSEEELQKVNQEIYKRNVELAEKNKLLSLLHRLYAITTKTLDIRTLAHDLIQSIVSIMGFPFVCLFIVDRFTKQLVPLAAFSAQNPKQQLFKTNQHVSLASLASESALGYVCKTHKRKQTTRIHEFVECYVQDSYRVFFRSTQIAVTNVVPLVTNGRIIGVLCIGLGSAYRDLTPFEKESLTSIINIIRIASDKALVYDELKQANLRLQELDKQKTEFLSIASHQLRTPLSIIKGYLELLGDGAYGKPTEKMREIYGNMDQSNERLIHLVDEFLNISRIEQGRTKFSYESKDVQAMIDGVMKELQPKADSKNLRLSWKHASETIEPISIDEEKIRHVVFNFVDNAIKYSDKGAVRVELALEDHGIAVRIKDQGLGFGKEDQANFFQKFYRGDNVKSTNVNGTGLGIYVCRKFIETHGGRVWAASPGIGKGSEFGFWIPYDAKLHKDKPEQESDQQLSTRFFHTASTATP